MLLKRILATMAITSVSMLAPAGAAVAAPACTPEQLAADPAGCTVQPFLDLTEDLDPVEGWEQQVVCVRTEGGSGAREGICAWVPLPPS